MAIVLEEEKRRFPLMAIIIILLVAIILGITIYYLFFVKPELMEIVFSPSLKTISELANIKFDPQTLMENPDFSILRPYGNFTSTTLDMVGKNNPFQP